MRQAICALGHALLLLTLVSLIGGCPNEQAKGGSGNTTANASTNAATTSSLVVGSGSGSAAAAGPSGCTPPKGMVCVAAAAAQIGAAGGEATERPVHPVQLSAFVIDDKLVSNTEYGACVTAGHCPKRKSQPDKPGGPAKQVSWKQAHKYCIWAGKRLPTEAEWESAAKQGKLTRDGDEGQSWVND